MPSNKKITIGTLVAKTAGVPRGHKVTSHPSVKDQLTDGKSKILSANASILIRWDSLQFTNTLKTASLWIRM